MADAKETTQKGNGKEHKPTKLGRNTRIGLIVVTFLVIFASLFFVYRQQAGLRVSLGQELASLQQQVSTSISKKTTLEEQIDQAEKEIQAAKLSFEIVDRAPDILGDLEALAKENDIDLTSSQIATTKRAFTIGKQKNEYPVLAMQLSFRGQVPNVQNFLIGLDATFPMAEVKVVTIDVAQEKDGRTEATITIDIYCLDKDDSK